jgi:hypothetical protein
MATAKEIIRAVALRTGTDLETVEELARSLIQSGVWSDEPRAIVDLLLALMADAESRSAASVAKHYYDLGLVGDDANSGTPTAAGEMMEQMLASFLARAHTPFSAYAYRSRIEVHAINAPGVCVVTDCTDVPLTLTYANDDWHRVTVRRINVLSGKALFDIAADIVAAHV